MYYQLIFVNTATNRVYPFDENNVTLYKSKNSDKMRKDVFDKITSICLDIPETNSFFFENPKYTEAFKKFEECEENYDADDEDNIKNYYYWKEKLEEINFVTCGDKYDIDQIIKNFNKEFSEGDLYLHLIEYSSSTFNIV